MCLYLFKLLAEGTWQGCWLVLRGFLKLISRDLVKNWNCVCEHHQEFKLLIMSLPMKSIYKDILKKVFCYINSRNCILHVCENCSGLDDVRNFITNCFNETTLILMRKYTCSGYHQIKQLLNKLTSSVDEYITLLANKVFALHS